MSNIIRLNAVEPKEKILSMSNQGTDTFLELIILSGAEQDMTVSQQRLIDYLAERREDNMNAPGTASFDVVKMPWSKETLQEDVTFMMGVIEKAEKPEISEKLNYRPDMRILTPWLRKFGQMIYGLDKDYVYGIEEREAVKAGLASIYSILIGNDAGAKRRLLYYLDWYKRAAQLTCITAA